jgi:hypothetical protein
VRGQSQVVHQLNICRGMLSHHACRGIRESCEKLGQFAVQSASRWLWRCPSFHPPHHTSPLLLLLLLLLDVLHSHVYHLT